MQAYQFRLCLTDVPENRVPFPKPAGYDPARYELLRRYPEKGGDLLESAAGLRAAGLQNADEVLGFHAAPPEFIRSDNGPDFIEQAVQDCIRRRGYKTHYIKPGSPWQDAYSGGFKSWFRDEFPNRGAFTILLEAKVLGKSYQQH